MAKLEPKEISLSEINNGNEYENGDIVDASSINSAIEASAYAQGKANEALDWVKGQGIPYHIGAIYMSTNPTSPASLFGGTWEQITEKFLLASSQLPTTGNPNPIRTYVEKDTGGSATVTLTGENLPNILAVGYNNSGVEKWISGAPWTNQQYADKAFIITEKYYLNEVGNNYVYNQPHDNMPPYYVVNIWRRTA